MSSYHVDDRSSNVLEVGEHSTFIKGKTKGWGFESKGEVDTVGDKIGRISGFGRFCIQTYL